ncbi:UrcA family protein [Sphingobium faniae]|nr:UrcA family protein [Sphingobium faniae]
MFAPFKTFSIAAFAAASMMAGSASAETFISNGRTFEVRFNDLDLSRTADQQELQDRIGRAASRVCSSPNLTEANRCRSNAIAHVKVPVATAIAQAQSKARYAEAGKEPLALAH